jgi:hypothetical protein
MNRDKVDQRVLAIACCIERARRIAARLHDSSLYWHVREACHSLAHQHGVRWGQVMSLYGQISVDPEMYDSRRVSEESEMFWSRVAPAELLVGEVHELLDVPGSA